MHLVIAEYRSLWLRIIAILFSLEPVRQMSLTGKANDTDHII